MYYKRIINSVILYIKFKFVGLQQIVISSLPFFIKTNLEKDINRAALIGCGHIIKNLYIYGFNKRSIKIVCSGLFSNSKEDMHYVQRNLAYKSVCYDNFDKLLNSGINSIIITTPNYSHYEYIIQGIDNGLNIFCEKPLANNIEEALNIRDLLKKNPITLMVGFQLRYSSIFNKLRELLKKKELGAIRKIRVHQFTDIEDHISSSAWLNDKKKSGGGVLFNVGIHSINLLFSLLGDVSTVASRLENLILPVDYGEDTAFCRLTFQTGITCFLNISYLSNANRNKKFSIAIYCEHGFINCNFHNNHIVMEDYLNKSTKYILFSEPEHCFVYNELNNFVYCINNNINPETDINDSIKTLQIIDGLYLADLQGKQVSLAVEEDHVNQSS